MSLAKDGGDLETPSFRVSVFFQETDTGHSKGSPNRDDGVKKKDTVAQRCCAKIFAFLPSDVF